MAYSKTPSKLYLSKSETLFKDVNLEGKFKAKKVETNFLLVDVWLQKKDYAKEIKEGFEKLTKH